MAYATRDRANGGLERRNLEYVGMARVNAERLKLLRIKGGNAVYGVDDDGVVRYVAYELDDGASFEVVSDA